MTVINSNINSLIAQKSLASNGRRLGDAMAQLSTGKRINSAADDAAGLAIGNKLTTQVRGLGQAMRNAADGVSMLQTADGGAEQITGMLIRMRELAVQTANDTNSSADRVPLASEFSELQAQIVQITDRTEWNGKKILKGTLSVAVFQVGAGSGQTITATLRDVDAITGMASAMAAALTAQSAEAISTIDAAISAIDTFRGDLGAKMNRLVYAADNANNVMTQTAASRSRIMDADYAKATSELARAQIIQQAGTAMLSQANQTPRSVLALLR